jgi:hypothetical protein
MERIVEVFRRTGKSVPVFCDKHFSYSWLKAKEMYGWSRELKFPLMAGSARARPLAHFDGLVHCMEKMFVTGKPLYPAEKTLLTTCALSILFESRAWKKKIETPELAIPYHVPRDAYFQRA